MVPSSLKVAFLFWRPSLEGVIRAGQKSKYEDSLVDVRTDLFDFHLLFPRQEFVFVGHVENERIDEDIVRRLRPQLEENGTWR
jgi:hypothetical protein